MFLPNVVSNTAKYCNNYSPVIAFHIAVVAQKLKIQCCYLMADMLNLKKWGAGAGSVVGRDGYKSS